MKKLFHNRPLVISVVILFIIFCGLLLTWFSALHVLNRMSFKEVTTNDMAAAMREDDFWSTYRFNSLIFEGKINSVSTANGTTTLGFVTSDPYGVSCQITGQTNNFKIGNTYKFGVEAYQAERQPHGVLLHNCINL